MENNPYVLAADNPTELLRQLRDENKPLNPSMQDGTGYSLIHAAASYSQLELLRALVNELNVDVNLLDGDGETCLFAVEAVEIARCLVEELGVDKTRKNNDGATAAEKITEEGSFPLVAAYLNDIINADVKLDGAGGVLPSNVKVSFGTTEQGDQEVAIDPAFKQRIDELVAKENFNSEEGQQELRGLVADVVRETNTDSQQPDAKRRLG
ncbi:hypothetical protein FQN49_006530 [Arthroderma sp. PD_2]|nr:hypothetical protein FQN49_006530 [Arthroderma sp. PD_2]